jgi:arginyl-tRNA synthetase
MPKPKRTIHPNGITKGYPMLLLPEAHARLIEAAIVAAQKAGDLPPFDLPNIEVRPPKRVEQADYACSTPLAIQKLVGRPPMDIAETIAKHLQPAPFLESAEVAKPGYINFRLSKDWLRQQVEQIIAEGDELAKLEVGKGKRAQVEFVSANPTGPLHVGRSRGAIVGDTIARILEAAGYSVEREYYFNNAGQQMRNLGNSLRIRYLHALGTSIEIPGDEDKSFYQGEYLIDIAKQLVAEKGNSLVEEDWQPFKEYAEAKIFDIIKATLKRVNIHHNIFFNENSLYDSNAVWETLKKLEQNGYIYKAVKAEVSDNTKDETEGNATDGKSEATWFRSSAMGDSADRVMVKATGEPTYALPDIAYHVNKLGRGFDRLVNILGADHYIEHQVVRYGLKALDLDPSSIKVIILQFVHLMRNGVRLKMSTRAGAIETLDELIDKTSADAVRYLLLARNANSDVDFDIELAVKQNNENPVYYIQNAHVRCAGIFREAAARGVSDEGADVSHLGENELAFVRRALELGEQIELAARELEPHRIAFYAMELAAIFHPVYDNVRALHTEVPPEVQKARLRFYRAAQIVFKRVLTLMGMSTPEIM